MGSMESGKGSDLTYCECIIKHRTKGKCAVCGLKKPPAGHMFYIMARIIPTGFCWYWNGIIDKAGGYGRIPINGKNYQAHRFIYELMVQTTIPPNMQADHLCRNRSCVNPDHIEIVTPAENYLRGFGVPAKNARKKFCVYGHPYDQDNTYYRKRGHRSCKICRKKTDKKVKDKIRARAALAKAEGID